MRKALTQDSLAHLAGLGRLAIIQLEQGAHEARPSTIAALAAALGETTAAVYDACCESFRRGAPGRLAANATTPAHGHPLVPAHPASEV